MKQWLKNIAIAGATAGAVVLGAASASAVSFTVVIEKIELMPNGNSTDRFVIYNPAVGIGASATTNLDLLNANKTGATLPVVAPKAGTYNTMLVTFSSIAVAAETATVSATQSLVASLGTAQGFGREQGRAVLVMGDPGTTATSISAHLNNVAPGTPFATVPTMQPVVSNGATVRLPAFDFFLPAGNVAISGNSVNVTKAPVALSVARADVDSAAVPNVTIGVKPTAFKSVTTAQGGTTGSTFAFKTGLFASSLDLMPVYIATSTATSSTAVTAGSVTEVTFLDVADGTYLPLAWVDANNNSLLDSGEPTVMATAVSSVVTLNNNTNGADRQRFLTINKADLFGASATTTGVVSSTSAAFQTSATAGTNTGAPLGDTAAANPTGFLGQSNGFYLFPERSISLTIAAADATSGTINYANDAHECDTACGLRGTWTGATIANSTATASLTFTIGNISTPVLTTRFDKDGTTTTGGVNIGTGNLFRLTFNNTVAAAAAASSTILSHSATGGESVMGVTGAFGSITLSPVPLTSITDINRNAAGFGTFSVGTSLAGANNGVASGTADAGTITQAVATLDADAVGNYDGTLNRVRLFGANQLSLSADLGN